MAKQTFTTGQVLTAAQMTSLQQTAMGGGSTTDKTTSYVLVAADAGTVIQMNAAGATTITVNTALFAAGDTVQIQNIGAGVCTITAGTATVNTAGSLALSQWEGGQLYFTSTSASIFFDTVQASSASGLTLINSTTFSGATSVAVDSVFSSTYLNYFIATYFTSVGSTNQTLGLRLRSSGTDDTAGNYINQGLRAYPSAVAYTGGVLTAFDLHTLSSANPAYGHHTVQLLGPNLANFTKINSLANGYTASPAYTYDTLHMSGLCATSTQYDGFKLFVASGNIAGTVKIYGYAN
jgi:hypothetical protein